MAGLKDNVAISCMFFAGLILLIPHRIGMSRVNYVIKRYNLPISRAGLLLYKYHNNIELSLLCGTLPMVVIICSVAKVMNDYIKWCMISFLFLMLISSIYMFILYISGGDFGHLNAFYFSLIFLTLFDGFANAFAFAINGPNASLLAAGIPLSGFLVTLLHYVYKFFYDSYHWNDFDYYVLRLQLIINNITLSVTFILWCCFDVDLYTSASFDLKPLFGLAEKPSGAVTGTNDEDFNHLLDWSPIGMLAFSLGTVYAFYPSIAPYSIIDFQYASIIELWILIISALLPLAMAILDLVSKLLPNFDKAYGPSGIFIVAYISSITITAGSSTTCPTPSNTTIKKAIKHNWVYSSNSSKGYGYLWNLMWLCAIFYILCIQIFMSMLHYPDCLLSSFFFDSPLATGFISILFNTLRELLQALGFSGAGKQVQRPTNNTIDSTKNNYCHRTTGNHNAGCFYGKKYIVWQTDPLEGEQHTVNGSIAATNKLITLFVMMFCVFTGDGYLQHYRRCCRDNWPTTGYNKYQSFFYWLHYGFKGGIKSITSSFTDLYYHDIRPQIISYA